MKEIIKQAISPYENNCDGYGNFGSSGNSYILGVTLGIGVAKKNFGHSGSTVLDEINAFDQAETDGPYIGQLNMSTVSSFCGPQGLVWGLDIVKHQALAKKQELLEEIVSEKGIDLPTYNGRFLIDSLEKLFGTVSHQKFILRPGAHVPFATKSLKVKGPKTIYCALCIGIPKDQTTSARLLMEDVGSIIGNPKTVVKQIKRNIARSVIQIGLNQQVSYRECYVVVKHLKIPKDQFGCALVAAPYFTLAKNAVPKTSKGALDLEKFVQMDLPQWEEEINGPKGLGVYN